MPKIDTTVGKLVGMIKDGELRLPEMQRRYVWPATRVRDLLDSLYRGYPSGTVLVWETEREMASRNLAVPQGSSPFKGHKLLLDGQQRLTSLSAVIRGEPVVVRNRKKPVEILFNLDHPDGAPVDLLEVEDDTTDAADPDNTDDEDDEGTSIQEAIKNRTFVVAAKSIARQKNWLRVTDIFTKSDGELLRGLVQSLEDPLYEKYTSRLQGVRRIQDYPYVMHVLDKSLSYEEVAEIFVRVNSLGMKLRGSDLALAQITSRWPDSLRLFEEFQEQCEEKWSTLDLGLIVRALVVFTTNQSRFKTVSSIPVQKLQQGWELARRGVEYSINFLSANAGMEDESLLSSPLFFLTPGYFASRRQFRVAAAEIAELRRWLYLANAKGHYTRGSSETILDSDLAIIRDAGGPAELLSALEQQVGRLNIEVADLVGRGQRSALFTTAYLTLKERGAKDWRTQLGLSLTHQGRYHFIQYHHIFPKAVLKKAGYQKNEANEIANMAFVAGGTNRSLSAKPPAEYLASVLKEQGPEALETHCIPLEPALWEIAAYPQFLQARRELLARALNAFVLGPTATVQAMDIARVITDGEDDTTEFKSSARWDYKTGAPSKALEAAVVKTIAGFMNTHGGRLVIGIGDDRRVMGLTRDYGTLGKHPDRDGYQQFLVNLFSNALGSAACARLRVSFRPLSGEEVCLIEVEPGPSPTYCDDGGDSRFYVRMGSTTRQLNAKEAVSYIGGHWPKTG